MSHHPEYDWATLRAVAMYFDADPHELRRVLATDEPERGASEWCEMPTTSNAWRNRQCGRRATAPNPVMGLHVCPQHENTLINGMFWWLINDAHVGDIQEVVQALGMRLKYAKFALDEPDIACSEDLFLADQLRAVLNDFLDRDAASHALAGLQALFGDAS